MGIRNMFALGVVVGGAVGFLVGVVTANPDDPRQQAIREYVRRVYEEAKKAAEEQESLLRSEYERRVGLG